MPAYNPIGTTTMQAGQVEDVSQILANFQAIAALLNGGLDDYNVKPAAGIAASKLAGIVANQATGDTLRYGNTVVALDASANGIVTYSTAFPVATLAVVALNADPAAGGNWYPVILAYSNPGTFSFLAVGSPALISVRCIYIAIGH